MLARRVTNGEPVSLGMESVDAPGTRTTSVEPREKRALDYAASGGVDRLQAQSSWNGVVVKTDLTHAPTSYRLLTASRHQETGKASPAITATRFYRGAAAGFDVRQPCVHRHEWLR